jgi:hypothetical protein
MGKIYSGIKGIANPESGTPFDYTVYERQTEDYVRQVQDAARSQNKCPEAGEIISFSVCDGRAFYVVQSLRPVELIHLDIYDGYQYEYANRLTAKDIREKIRQNKVLCEIFGVG